MTKKHIDKMAELFKAVFNDTTREVSSLSKEQLLVEIEQFELEALEARARLYACDERRRFLDKQDS